jgi:L-cystine uptake protein TcyP (sodium:dicarboxylate symporter family)
MHCASRIRAIIKQGVILLPDPELFAAASGGSAATAIANIIFSHLILLSRLSIQNKSSPFGDIGVKVVETLFQQLHSAVGLCILLTKGRVRFTYSAGRWKPVMEFRSPRR